MQTFDCTVVRYLDVLVSMSLPVETCSCSHTVCPPHFDVAPLLRRRVTCRDWFQLTLKEGLTVYRDQVGRFLARPSC